MFIYRPNYDPQNWYWYVGGDQTQAYSSASGAFVPAADATFQAWLAAGNQATAIDTAAALAGVLANANAPRPVDATVLAAWQTAKISAMDMVQFKILFNHENRIRTLAGQGQVTAQQFMTAIAGLL